MQEPGTFCDLGYGAGSHAPGLSEPGVLPYKCAHTVLKSHAMAYRIYEREFKETQKGVVGIILNSDWNEPASDKPEDIEAAERAIQFWVRLTRNVQMCQGSDPTNIKYAFIQSDFYSYD